MLSHINKELEELKFPMLKAQKKHSLNITLVKQLTLKAFKDHVLLIKTKQNVGFPTLLKIPS